MYNTLHSVLLYGAESLNVTKEKEHQLRVLKKNFDLFFKQEMQKWITRQTGEIQRNHQKKPNDCNGQITLIDGMCSLFCIQISKNMLHYYLLSHINIIVFLIILLHNLY